MSKQAKIVWIVAIVAMGMTSAMNLLGGIGTVCAAFFTKDFPPMWKILDYQWLYQRLMLITIVIGIVHAWITLSLFRGGQHAHRNAIIVLLIGTMVADLNVSASLHIRGKAVPTNVKLYINLFTLILFLILRLPSVHKHVNFSRSGGKAEIAAAGGTTALMAGLIMLSIGFWAGPSHTFEGENWINVLQPELSVGGLAMVLLGVGLFIKAARHHLFQQPEQNPLAAESRINP